MGNGDPILCWCQGHRRRSAQIDIDQANSPSALGVENRNVAIEKHVKDLAADNDCAARVGSAGSFIAIGHVHQDQSGHPSPTSTHARDWFATSSTAPSPISRRKRERSRLHDPVHG